MPVLQVHTRQWKSILAMLVILFALAPCSLKESLYTLVDVELGKPLNKSRATIFQADSCTSFVHASSQNHKDIKSPQKLLPLSYSGLDSGVVCQPVSGNLNGSHWSNFTHGNPPKYILFRQLKINMV